MAEKLTVEGYSQHDLEFSYKNNISYNLGFEDCVKQHTQYKEVIAVFSCFNSQGNIYKSVLSTNGVMGLFCRECDKGITRIGKSLFFIVLLFGLFFISWLNPSQSSASVQSLDQEARIQAEKFFGTIFNTCGNSSYCKQSPGEQYGYNVVYEVKGLHVSVSPSELSEADSLNGIQWKGNIELTFRVNREFYSHSKEWSQWHEGTEGIPYLRLSMIKAKSKWSFPNRQYLGNSQWQFVKGLDCSELSKDGKPIPEVFSIPKQPFTFTVNSLSFFESGYDVPPYHLRNRGSKFFTSTAKYISWELGLRCQPQQQHEFAIKAIFYNPDGSILNEHTIQTVMKQGTVHDFFNDGYGNQTTRIWKPGIYKVDLFIENKKVASGTFEMVGENTSISSAPPISVGRYTIKQHKYGGDGTLTFSILTIDIPDNKTIIVNVSVKNDADKKQHFWFPYKADENFFIVDNLGRKTLAQLPVFKDRDEDLKSVSSGFLTNHTCSLEAGERITESIRFLIDTGGVTSITFVSAEHPGHQMEIRFKDIVIRSYERGDPKSTTQFPQ